jgi:hypothetical protein
VTQKKLTDGQKYRNSKERQRIRQAEYRKHKQAAGLQQVVLYVPRAEYTAAKEGGLCPVQIVYGLPTNNASPVIVSPENNYSVANMDMLARIRAKWESKKVESEKVDSN